MEKWEKKFLIFIIIIAILFLFIRYVLVPAVLYGPWGTNAGFIR
jgi:hypothetical protein